MPMVRKLITVGNSRAITIPDDWLKYHEERLGKTLDTLLMEVNTKITLKIDTGEPPTVLGLEKWRKAVLKRDNYTCQRCGDKKHHNIIAHHKIDIKVRPELALDVENGETLCQSCHIKVHYRGPSDGNRTEKATIK